MFVYNFKYTSGEKMHKNKWNLNDFVANMALAENFYFVMADISPKYRISYWLLDNVALELPNLLPFIELHLKG